MALQKVSKMCHFERSEKSDKFPDVMTLQDFSLRSKWHPGWSQLFTNTSYLNDEFFRAATFFQGWNPATVEKNAIPSW